MERVIHDANYETFELLPISQEIVQVQVKKNKGYERIGLRTNIIIGSYVTSLARTEMYKAMLKLNKENMKIFYTDTDSLILSRKETTPLPLQINNAIFGCYKHEVTENIEVFYSLGPKNYCLKTTNEIQIKCRGFFLKSSRGKAAITENVYKEFIEALVNEDKAIREVIPQFKISFDKKAGKLYSHMQLKAFCSHVFNKRILLKPKDDKIITFSLPFGYDEDLLNKVIEIYKK